MSSGRWVDVSRRSWSKRKTSPNHPTSKRKTPPTSKISQMLMRMLSRKAMRWWMAILTTSSKSSLRKLLKINQQGVAETYQKVVMTKILLLIILQKALARMAVRAVLLERRKRWNRQLIWDRCANRSTFNTHAWMTLLQKFILLGATPVGRSL